MADRSPDKSHEPSMIAQPPVGAYLCESIETYAKYWLNAAREARDAERHGDAMMYAEQAVNGWKNLAYDLARQAHYYLMSQEHYALSHALPNGVPAFDPVAFYRAFPAGGNNERGDWLSRCLANMLDAYEAAKLAGCAPSTTRQIPDIGELADVLMDSLKEAGYVIGLAAALHVATAVRYRSARSVVSATLCIPLVEIEAEIDHIQQNGMDLAKFGGQNVDEGRCRELCAMYLREFIQGHKLQQQLDALCRADGGKA